MRRNGGASRRSAVFGAAALSAWPWQPATALDRDAVTRKLSRVPVFVVTNRQESPYLTEMDEQGRRSGNFFLNPETALAAYKDIKGFDPAASLSVVSLDGVYFDLARSPEEAALAPQPKAGASADLRLFTLRPLEGEGEAARKLGAAAGPPLAPYASPLFYDTSLALEVDGVRQRPYFFRLGDLRRTFEAGGPDREPELRVTSLDALVQKLLQGKREEAEDVLLVAAADAAAVVERMGVADADADATGEAAPAKGGAAVGEAPGAEDMAEDRLVRTAATTPFGQGGR